jgi:hypothetical protein
LVAFFLGGWVGFHVGRWRAERGRARFEMGVAWKGRKRYRPTRLFW